MDSASQIILAVKETRAYFNLPPVPDSEIYSLIGRPAKELFKADESNESNVPILLDYFRMTLEEKYMTVNKVFPFSEILLENLTKNKCLIGIATSKPTYLAVKALNNSILNKFSMTIQGTDNFPSKPHPDVILKCIQSLRTTINFMVGDRSEDMIAGKQANCVTIGLEQGAHDRKLLTASGADFVFSSIEELNSELNRILESF